MEATYDTTIPPPEPSSAAAAVATPSKKTAGVGQAKRNHRQRKDHSQSLPQLDGAVSDSVAHSRSSPHFQNTPRQRHQSVALGAAPSHAQHVKHSHDQRQRPASHGANVLPNTPLKEQAYAGPTFQASPAPSSLPVPKFFSRSVPNVAAQSSLAQRMERESDRTPEKESSPEPDVVAPHPPDRESQKSPLDVFFRADRQERERTRSGSGSGSGSGFSPEMARKQIIPPTQAPIGQQPHTNAFLPDLDGSGRDMTGQGRLTLPNGHPQPCPPTSSPGAATRFPPPPSASDAESDRETKTQALKALLFNNINSAQPQSPQNSTPPPLPSNPYASTRTYETPSPFQRSTSGPSTPAPYSEYQQYNHNYHYGNQRNLSPLFKAASGRNDTPSPRPSGLRKQEFPPEIASHTHAAPHQTTLQPPRVIDPNTVSRDYIGQHTADSGNATRPTFPFANGVPLHHPSSSSASSVLPANFPRGAAEAKGSTTPNSIRPARTTPDGVASGGGNARDVQGMEDDLRRMLNLKVLSN